MSAAADRKVADGVGNGWRWMFAGPFIVSSFSALRILSINVLVSCNTGRPPSTEALLPTVLCADDLNATTPTIIIGYSNACDQLIRNIHKHNGSRYVLFPTADRPIAYFDIVIDGDLARFVKFVFRIFYILNSNHNFFSFHSKLGRRSQVFLETAVLFSTSIWRSSYNSVASKCTFWVPTKRSTSVSLQAPANYA